MKKQFDVNEVGKNKEVEGIKVCLEEKNRRISSLESEVRKLKNKFYSIKAIVFGTISFLSCGFVIVSGGVVASYLDNNNAPGWTIIVVVGLSVLSTLLITIRFLEHTESY